MVRICLLLTAVPRPFNPAHGDLGPHYTGELWLRCEILAMIRPLQLETAYQRCRLSSRTTYPIACSQLNSPYLARRSRAVSRLSLA